MKLRRSDRMVVISNYLINNPYKLTSLNTFAEKYESAKSSISEDIVIIKRAFEEIEIGTIETITGAGGAFGMLIRDSGVGDVIAKSLIDTALPPILLPFIIATLIRFIQGSGTVAMITAASITAPIISKLNVSKAFKAALPSVTYTGAYTVGEHERKILTQFL